MENKELNECLACGSTELYNFVNFGDSMPLANTYPEKSGTKVPTYPLQMFVCGKCTHTQLGIAVDPDLLFKDYLYVSGTTDTLKNHFQAFAQKAIKRAQVSDPHVLDIGCNDGSLMMAFREEGLTHVDGVDPAENLRAERDTKLGYMTIVDYWSLEVARRMEHKFHIITGLNVFAHNSDPLGFLQACKEVLDPLGEIIIEFPYGKNVYLEAQEYSLIIKRLLHIVVYYIILVYIILLYILLYTSFLTSFLPYTRKCKPVLLSWLSRIGKEGSKEERVLSLDCKTDDWSSGCGCRSHLNVF
jgi:SAM-dependent methyltransferase